MDRTDQKGVLAGGRDGAEGEIDKFRDSDNGNGAYFANAFLILIECSDL